MNNLHLATQGFHAYIDAGTGTIIIQMLIAGAVAGLFMLKTFWGKVRIFLDRLFKKGNK